VRKGLLAGRLDNRSTLRLAAACLDRAMVGSDLGGAYPPNAGSGSPVYSGAIPTHFLGEAGAGGGGGGGGDGAEKDPFVEVRRSRATGAFWASLADAHWRCFEAGGLRGEVTDASDGQTYTFGGGLSIFSLPPLCSMCVH